jgi:hypothetical protein
MMAAHVAVLVNVIMTFVAVIIVIVAAAEVEVEAAIGAPMTTMTTTTTAPGRGCLGRRMHVAMDNAAIVTNDGKMRVAIRVSNNATIEIEEIQSTG